MSRCKKISGIYVDRGYVAGGHAGGSTGRYCQCEGCGDGP